MQNLFWGAVFLLLNVNIVAGESLINILPCFVGYILIYRGLNVLAGKTLHFEKIKPFCAVMTVYELLLWIIDICALRYAVAAILAQVVSSAASIFVFYHISEGIGDIQRKSSIDLGYEKLCKYWKYFVILCSVSYIFSFVFVKISMILMIASIVFGWFFLSAFYKTKNNYYDNL